MNSKATQLSQAEACWGLQNPRDYDPLTPTIFHEKWWLDIATRGQWSAVEVVRNGCVVARMPYFSKRRLWFTTSRNPMITHFLGPALTPGWGSPNTRFLWQVEITRELIRQLPPMGLFHQKMHRGIADTIAFQMEGFETSVQFTYELTPKPPEILWRNMRDKTRNVTRQAERVYTIDDAMSADEFVSLYRSNLASRGLREAIDMDLVTQLVNGSCSKGCGQVLAARNKDGVAKAAIFCVWDMRVCYFLLETRAIDSGNGAITMLVGSAIRRSSAGGLTFDFGGLGHPGAVRFYTGFGADVRPRYIVSKSSLAFRLSVEVWRLLGNPSNPLT